MLFREIVHTCSNSHVARAAVDSIGGEFAERFAADASDRNLSPGVWASKLVREFAGKADEVEWQRVGVATRGADQPILTGLRYILEHGVRETRRASKGGGTPPAWMIAATRCPA
jgi:hypothetical protein